MQSIKTVEITFRAIVLSILLAIILAAANAYLGLKAGITVSASIPAAVISMGILRFFKNSSILENNIVQTAASAGEALVAGVIFILPALIILNFWQDFNYWETTFIAMIGGTLGVLFSIPLRRILLAESTLRFPEGTAIGEVLKISRDEKTNLSDLVKGGVIGSSISLLQSGFQVVSSNLQFWFKANTQFIYGFGFGFEPALLAAGYIVGINVCMSIFTGVLIGWIVGIPILSYLQSFDLTQNATSVAIQVWKSDVRYIGVGTMLIGGIWTLLTLIKPIFNGLRSSFASVKTIQKYGYNALPKTERDIPIHYAFIALLIVAIPLTLLINHFITHLGLPIDVNLKISVLALSVLFIILGGFIFASICGYFAGLVGSSNNPISGLAMSALLIASFALLGLLNLQPNLLDQSVQKLAVAGLVVFITTGILTAAAITNDTIQDLKTGQIVGATPWKQQMMLILGVLVSALVIPPILKLLFNAYGIGNILPREGMDATQALAAPQAMLMATLIQGLFEHQLPWALLITGAILAVGCIILDTFLKAYNRRFPVLAVGLGIYLPLGVSMSLVLGGVTAYLANRTLQPNKISDAVKNRQRGLVGACGIVAGAALTGMALAIPFTLARSTSVLKFVGDDFASIANALGVITTILVLAWLYRITCKK